MAQFISFVNGVEVNKQTIESVVNAMENGKENRIQILKDNGIHLESRTWFSQQSWLDSFKVMSKQLGDMNLFLIGKAIIDSAKFPPMKNLEEALNSIDIAYHMNHRLNGKVMFEEGRKMKGIGNYTLTEFNEKDKTAVMVCNNPYPSKFDEGIITQIVRKFKPYGSNPKVRLDGSKESRVNGAESCTFIITW